jgi:hypothetical protein
MFVYLEKLFNAEFVDMYVMVSLRTALHMPNSGGSFIIVTKPKCNYRLHAAAILLSYTEKEPF